MSGKAKEINLIPEERQRLESWVRASTTEQRLVQRARIILDSAAGRMTKEIAREMALRPGTVSKWRTRFSEQRLSGLTDAPRGSGRQKYDETTEKRILAALDNSPPEGYATWSGKLLAKSVGDVSDDQVWRVLRKHGIHLRRRRSWCVSTDPQFSQKAADIVGLYLEPPENALVICVDEKPSIQALERVQGWLRLPDGQAVRGFNHEYKRHGTTTLFAALEVATGLVQAGHYPRRRRREFLDFMNEVISGCPDKEIHVVLDNLNTHKPKRDNWLKRHPHIHFHYTPTHASWLNQVECWFSILWRQGLQGASFASTRQVRQAIDKFIAAYNPQATPFEWHKKTITSTGLKYHYADLCN
ncbi:MAG: IS630 family transposase [Chloroflexi bacterium]|nr:IS630 family transposase [Chloroflexota bacterium]